MDETIELLPTDLDDIEKTLTDVGILPKGLKLDRPDQSCRKRNY